MTESRFGWYEKVMVNSGDPAKNSINGKLGAVLGKAQSDDGRWSYAVSIYDSGIVWSCCDDELISTGEFDTRESFYGGDTVRVNSRGEIVD
jgi:hypothetical protein